ICRGQSYAGYDSAGTYIDTYTNATGCDSVRTLHLTVNSCAAPTCPLTNSIIINTGYDPVAKTELAPGQKDTHWIVTRMSSQMQNALCYNLNTTTPQAPPNVPTVPPVPLDQYTDVIAGSVGSISCFPVNTMYTSMPPLTLPNGNFSYTMDIKRSFFVSGGGTQNVNFNFTTTCDDAIDSIIIDAGLPSKIVLLNVMTETVGTGSPLTINYTTSLSPGLHTLSIQCANWENPGGIYYPITVNGVTSQYQWNPFVVNITGSISTVNNVLVNNSCFTPTYSTIDTSICQGQSYLGYNVTGTYADTLTNVAGYDSIRTVNLTVNNCTPVVPCNVTNSLIINTGYNPNTNTVIPVGQEDSNWKVTYASPAMLVVAGEVAIDSGTWIVANNPVWPLNPTSNYISSVNNGTNGYNTTLSPDGTYTSTETRTFTTFVADNITFNLNITGDNYISGLSIDGDPNLITGPPNYLLAFTNFTFTNFLHPGSHTISVTLVNATTDKAYTNNDNYSGLNVYGTVSSSTGINSLMAPGSAGNCVYTALISYSIIDTSICQGQSYLGYNVTGTYVDTLTNVAGYDSIRTVNLIIKLKSFITIDTSICQGQSLLGYTTTGSYIDTIQNVAGCDSVITLNLTVIAKSFSIIDTSLCSGLSFRGHTATGTYIDTIPNVAGCDSIMTLNLIIKPKSFSTIPATICQGQNYLGYTTTGTHIDTLVAANGCDSIRTINLTVTPYSRSTIPATICQGQSYLGYTTTGTFVDTLVAANGCDSIRTVDLTVTPYSRSTIPMSICQGQNYFGYTTTGTFVDTLIANHGCDSIRTINLTVNSSSSSIVDTSICPGEASHGYTNGGTYTIILTNAVGCDSTITLNLIVKRLPVVKTNNDTSICKGTTFQASTTGATTYSWSPLTSLTFPDNTSDPVINTITPIQYIVTGTTNGCSASDTLNIGIDPLPVVSKSNDVTICVDSSTRIYA
ncbi:MAG TPA: hypothetical protein VNZ45_05995, partial [Bacteroidia bacterium]|nr:hypothetical protein [Bacteroidia bacterium]